MQNTSERHTRISARMIGRWGEFYAWLSERHAFGAEFTPAEPQFCPAHGGDSGQAFRFYSDAEFTGGGICNSCPHMRAASGIDLVAGWLRDRALDPVAGEEAQDRACELLEQWFSEAGVPDVPSDIVATRLSEWVRALRSDVAAAYFASRGLPSTPADLPPAVRAVEGEVRSLVLARDGRPTTYHAIRLDAQRHRVPGRGAKRTASVNRTVPLSGAFVDLTRPFRGGQVGRDPGASATLLVAEGVETALAAEVVYRAAVEDHGPLLVRALLGGLDRLAKQQIPSGVRHIVVFADNDHTQPKAFEAAAAVRTATKLPVQVVVAPATPRHPKPDWLDALVERGLEETASLLRRALAQETAESSGAPGGGGEAAASVQEQDALIRRDPRTGRIQISLSITPDPDLFELLNRLVRTSPPQQWYWHVLEGVPVMVSPGGGQRQVDARDAVAWASERIESYNAKGDAVGTPAGRVTAWFHTLAVQAWLREHLPPLVGVLRAPRLLRVRDESAQWVFRTEPGYDPRTQTVLHLPDGERAALERARAVFEDFGRAGNLAKTVNMLREILGEAVIDLLYDFDFDSESSRAAAAAALVTPMFSAASENVPMFLIDAPQRGSGKTTLANLIATIWGGAHQFGFPKNDDAEFEKRLGAAFQSGAAMIVIDNVSHRLVSDTLARVLTDRQSARIRILGTNTVTSAPLGLCFIATGSNIEVQEEIKRRAVPIRLEPKVLDPAARTAFIHPDLLSYTADRVEGLRAMLYCCLMAWCAHYQHTEADHPFLRRADLPLFAGFEDWGALVDSFLRAFLPWFGGFLENRAKWICDGDAQTQSTQEFVDVWWTAFSDTVIRSSDLVQRVLPEAPVVYERNASMQNLSRAIAKFAGAIRGRRFRVGPPDDSATVVEVQVLQRRFDNRRKGYRLAPVTACEAGAQTGRPAGDGPGFGRADVQ